MHLYIYTQKLQVYRYFLLCIFLMWLYRKRKVIYFNLTQRKHSRHHCSVFKVLQSDETDGLIM